MNAVRAASCLVLVFAGALSAFGGIVVVDAAGGPGSSFTALQPAIDAASPGDVILIRSGTYVGPHELAFKGVSIVADAGAHVELSHDAGIPSPHVEAPLVVHGLQPGRVVLRGLDLRGTGLSNPPSHGLTLIFVTGAGADLQQPIFVEECAARASGDGFSASVVTRGVVLTRCEAKGGPATIVANPSGPFVPFSLLPPGNGARLGRPVAVYGGRFEGGDGIDGPTSAAPVNEFSYAGGLGLGVGSVVPFGIADYFVGGAIAAGGLGTDGSNDGGPCIGPGDGGPGLVVAGVGGLADVTALGGLPGDAAPGCPAASPGADIHVMAGAPQVFDVTPGQVVAPRTAREGAEIQIAIEGEPGRFALLIVGFDPTLQYAPQLSGMLTVQPAAIVALGALPPSGSLHLAERVPEIGAAGLLTYFQPVLVETSSGAATLGGPSVTLLLDASY